MKAMVSIVIGVVVAGLLFRRFFYDAEDFVECVRCICTPRILTRLFGQSDEEAWASWRTFGFAGLSVGAGVIAFFGLGWIFG